MKERLGFTVEQFAEAHGIGRTLVYAEAKAGRLKLAKVGRRSIVTVEAAASWRRLLDGEADHSGSQAA